MTFGTIIKVKDRYRAFCPVNGKRTSKYFDTEKQASDWLAKCQTEQATGVFIEPSKMTVGQWILEYMSTYAADNVKLRTKESYKYAAKKLTPITNIQIQKLTPYHIQRVLNGITSPSMRPNVYTFLSTILKKAVKLHIITSNPLDAVEKPKYQGKKKKPFTDMELNKIKSAISKFKHGNVFLTMLATGCRIGEVLALKIHNVHKNYIHIDSTTGRKITEVGTPKSLSSVRDIPIPLEISKILNNEWRKHNTLNGYVFSNTNGTHLSYRNLLREWKDLLQSVGVEYRPTHNIRHTHATNLLHQFDFVEVQHRLGHSSASITLNTYGHTKDETTPAIVSAVSDMIK